MAADTEAGVPPGRTLRPALNPEAASQIEIKSVADFGSMMDLDLSSLDDDWTYRWVNVTPVKVGRAKAKGYLVVNANEERIRNAVGDAPAAEDGAYRVGDLVLMKVRKVIRRNRRKKLAKVRDEKLTGPVKSFKKRAKVRGRRRYQTPVEVITTKDVKGGG